MESFVRWSHYAETRSRIRPVGTVLSQRGSLCRPHPSLPSTTLHQPPPTWPASTTLHGKTPAGRAAPCRRLRSANASDPLLPPRILHQPVYAPHPAQLDLNGRDRIETVASRVDRRGEVRSPVPLFPEVGGDLGDRDAPAPQVEEPLAFHPELEPAFVAHVLACRVLIRPRAGVEPDAIHRPRRGDGIERGVLDQGNRQVTVAGAV